MPQIQVLPQVPTFGEKLIPVLAEAGNRVAQGFQQRNAQSALQKLLNPQAAAQGQANAVPGQLGAGEQSAVPNMGAQSPAISPTSLPQIHALATQAYGEKGADALIQGVMQEQKLNRQEAQQTRQINQTRQSKVVEKKQLENVGKRSSFEAKRRDINAGLAATRSGEVGGIDRNYFANLFGEKGEFLKNLQGAKLQSSVKHLLIEDLQAVTGQKNQWIERQFSSSLPALGKQAVVNEALYESALADLDIKEKILDTEESLIAEYEKQGIIPPSNVDQLAHQIVKPYALQREQQLNYDTQRLIEKEGGERYLNNLKPVYKGTYLTLEKRDALLKKFNGDVEKVINYAEKLGYTIPDAQLIMRSQGSSEGAQ